MKWSFVGVGAIVAGLIGLSVLLLFQDITTKNEQDYYLLKEATQGAMIDSVDLTYYRSTGEIKISNQKFMANFIRRYAENSNFNSSGYDIEFYDIIEIPPKVSVRVKTKSRTINISTEATDFDIVNQLDAILETIYGINSIFTEEELNDNNSDINNHDNPLEGFNHNDFRKFITR